MKILLVEDEESLQKLLMLNLEMENYKVVLAKDGKEAIERFKSEIFDLIILDVMLPEMNGYEVCERIRLTNQRVPILFLTARDSPEDRINGLRLGADDYLIKPFQLEELLLRIKSILKRSNETVRQQVEELVFGENKINLNTHLAQGQHGEFHLTKMETKLIKLFYDNRNRAISREQILQMVWGYDVIPSTRTIDNFILNFRKQFEVDPKKPKYFHSVRGVGYKFNYEV